jgi:hypothetical protein
VAWDGSGWRSGPIAWMSKQLIVRLVWVPALRSAFCVVRSASWLLAPASWLLADVMSPAVRMQLGLAAEFCSLLLRSAPRAALRPLNFVQRLPSAWFGFGLWLWLVVVVVVVVVVLLLLIN